VCNGAHPGGRRRPLRPRFDPVAVIGHNGGVSAAPTPTQVERPDVDDVVQPDLPWITIVWNDPVNLMSYVTYVFRQYFGYPKSKAEKLMRQVHNDGKAVVSSGGREEMERDVQAMHGYGLWATMEKSDA
jgi:ATP-dependent Clp protease adaptor protein ClpS